MINSSLRSLRSPKNMGDSINPDSTQVGTESINIYEEQKMQFDRLNTPSILPRFGSLAEMKEIQKGKKEIVKNLNEYFIGTIKKINEMKSQQLDEAINDVLIKGKSIIRASRSAFFMEQKAILQYQLDKMTDDFLAHIQKRIDRIVSMQDGLDKEMAEETTKTAINSWKEDVNLLIAEFSSTLREYKN